MSGFIRPNRVQLPYAWFPQTKLHTSTVALSRFIDQTAHKYSCPKCPVSSDQTAHKHRCSTSGFIRPNCIQVQLSYVWFYHTEPHTSSYPMSGFNRPNYTQVQLAYVQFHQTKLHTSTVAYVWFHQTKPHTSTCNYH